MSNRTKATLFPCADGASPLSTSNCSVLAGAATVPSRLATINGSGGGACAGCGTADNVEKDFFSTLSVVRIVFGINLDRPLRQFARGPRLGASLGRRLVTGRATYSCAHQPEMGGHVHRAEMYSLGLHDHLWIRGC